MSHTVRTADLQVGMKVVNPIVGKKGEVKVNKGEILSAMHVEKLNKWKGLDSANPRGIEIESSPKHSGDEMPRVVDKPWESPIIEARAKQKLQTSISVSVAFDKEGNIVRDDPVVEENQEGTADEVLPDVVEDEQPTTQDTEIETAQTEDLQPEVTPVDTAEKTIFINEPERKNAPKRGRPRKGAIRKFFDKFH